MNKKRLVNETRSFVNQLNCCEIRNVDDNDNDNDEDDDDDAAFM
jgi:hypothetical protein